MLTYVATMDCQLCLLLGEQHKNGMMIWAWSEILMFYGWGNMGHTDDVGFFIKYNGN